MPHGLEALDLITERTGETTVDVQWAAAHAGDGAHLLHPFIGQFANDEGLARSEGVAEDPCDFHRERLRLGALENSPDFPSLAGLELGERIKRCVRGLRHHDPGECTKHNDE
jgi:hypothetical protein